jgi:hypothetical protein
LDLAALKQHPSLDSAGVAWTAVEEWTEVGKRLSSGEDLQCSELGACICRLLWDNAAAIHTAVELVIGRDITNKMIRRP